MFSYCLLSALLFCRVPLGTIAANSEEVYCTTTDPSVTANKQPSPRYDAAFRAANGSFLDIQTMAGGYNVKRAHHFEVGSTQTITYDLIEAYKKISVEEFQSGHTDTDDPFKPPLFPFSQQFLCEKDILLVTADSQIAGVGTAGRVWQSPIGNIYATYVFPRPTAAHHLTTYVPQVVTLAILRTLQQYGLKPEVKWVNDVLLNGKKTAGVLTKLFSNVQYFQQGTSIPSALINEAIVFGVGLNVNMNKEVADSRYESIIDPMKVRFTSMLMESQEGRLFDTEEVLLTLTTNIVGYFRFMLNAPNFKTTFETEINAYLAFKGEKVNYSYDGAEADTEPATVILVGVNAMGHAILRSPEGGSEVTVFSGRIRPVPATSELQQQQ